jgi:ABC-type multidrug transport system ATPase subunit
VASAIISTQSIVKDYPQVRALDQVGLEIFEGEIFGLFGPNAAGKTTCIRVLTGITKPNSGNATVCGIDLIQNPVGVRRYASILPEIYYMYEKISVAKYLRFYARMNGLTTNTDAMVQRVLSMLEMESKADTKINILSMGQKQRIEIARVLLGTFSNAKVLFLDEPFNNVDIQMRRKLRDYLRGFLQDGRSIFFTSHNLIESEYIVDRFAFILKGRIAAVGTAKDLKEKFLVPTFFLEIQESDIEKSRNLLLKNLETYAIDVVEHGLRITLKKRDDIPRISTLLVENGIDVYELRALGTMEDVFDRVVS